MSFNLNLSIIFVFIAVQITYLINGYEYCKKEGFLCNNEKHIACTTKNDLLHKGGRDLGTLAGIYYNTKLLSEALTGWHNMVRNNVSGGITFIGAKKSRTACRMREMAWDFELAHLAQLHASKCVEAPDCHNTVKFPSSGQNLLVISIKKNLTSIQDIIDAVKVWLEEKNRLEPLDLISGIDRFALEGIEHFTLIVNEQNAYLGCAMAKCAKAKETNILLVCNYSCQNIANEPMYEPDIPNSDCSYWKSGLSSSSKYPYLCAPTV